MARLLFVADESTSAAMIGAVAALRAAGHEIEIAVDAAAARERAANAAFDLALVDLDLVDGIALCDELSSKRRFALPVVALASKGEPVLARLESTCRDVLEKPIEAVLLVRRVDAALELIRLARELEESKARVTLVQRLARLGSFEIDWNARTARLSDEARRLYGFPEGTVEIALDELQDVVAKAQRDDWRAWLADVAAGATERAFEHRMLRRDQTERVVRLHAERHLDRGDSTVRLHAIVHDITDRRRVEEELEYQALHDDLTGLANRRQLLEDLERAIDVTGLEQRLIAVLFVDLDRFKDVNESLGHAAGDRLLVTVSERLRECVREDDPVARSTGGRVADSIARIGGDEFTIVISGLHDQREASSIAQRVLDVLARPLLAEEREVYLTSCIGIAVHPHAGADPRKLLKDAETAMYHAKERGRATWAFYDPSMERVADERLAVRAALRRALEHGDLEVWYQPRVDLTTGRIVGMEALVRWHHPQLGMLKPSHFIPVAEESGLILPVGTFVLKEACAQIRRWHDAGFTELRVAVNVSAEQFRDPGGGLPDMVERVAAEAGVAPEVIELELTESILMRDVERALETLKRLKQKGFHLSIDDFGTGYSSLSYLKRFPIDCLKIDCSFVRDVETDAGDAAITAAILFMAHSLKLDVVAEGVETLGQVEFLKCHRCDQVQGYYFSEPLPAAAATALLEKQIAQPLPPAGRTPAPIVA